jgi:hypothetical protein
MKFTDNDLQDLRLSKQEDCEWIIPWDKFKALLDRIEKAETIVSSVERLIFTQEIKDVLIHCQLLEFKNSAGKLAEDKKHHD